MPETLVLGQAQRPSDEEGPTAQGLRQPEEPISNSLLLVTAGSRSSACRLTALIVLWTLRALAWASALSQS